MLRLDGYVPAITAMKGMIPKYVDMKYTLQIDIKDGKIRATYDCTFMMDGGTRLLKWMIKEDGTERMGYGGFVHNGTLWFK